MAIFSPGPLVGRISGTVGGTNFANSNNGPVIRQGRASSKNANPNIRPSQVELQRQIARWGELSDLDRQAWIQFARTTPIPNRLGIQRYRSGYQTFLHYNLFAETDTPPTGNIEATTPIVSFGTGAGFLAIEFDSIPSGDTVEGRVYGRPLYRSTPLAFNNSWRFVQTVSVTGTTASVSINAAWVALFGSYYTNQYVACRFIQTVDDLPVAAPVDQIIQV